jgi:myo-inositol 2-dehydrogenase / D-chiro-inositol 1-dehydrogenase
MINAAVFGAGRIGKVHTHNIASLPGVALHYVVDVNPVAASELAGVYGAKPATIEAALGDPEVQAVVIATSTDTHADLIQRAAAAGKAIFCEKPVDLALERARLCAEAVTKAGVLCGIGFQRRFDATFAALKTRLDAGEIGEPETLLITSRDPGAPPVSYIKVSGGIFKDMLIHDFDIFRWILEDEAVSIHATGSCLVDPAIGEAGDVDTTAVTIRTRKGRLCQINTTRRAAYGYDQRFEVLGSAGMLQAGNPRPTEVTASTKQSVNTDIPEPLFFDRYRVAFAAEMKYFFDAVGSGKSARTDIHDGVKALELAEAATLSWREQRVVELNV